MPQSRTVTKRLVTRTRRIVQHVTEERAVEYRQEMTRAELACLLVCTRVLVDWRISLGLKGGLIRRLEKRFLSKQDHTNGGTHG